VSPFKKIYKHALPQNFSTIECYKTWKKFWKTLNFYIFDVKNSVFRTTRIHPPSWIFCQNSTGIDFRCQKSIRIDISLSPPSPANAHGIDFCYISHNTINASSFPNWKRQSCLENSRLIPVKSGMFLEEKLKLRYRNAFSLEISLHFQNCFDWEVLGKLFAKRKIPLNSVGEILSVKILSV
jgi:hypothetical protein